MELEKELWKQKREIELLDRIVRNQEKIIEQLKLEKTVFVNVLLEQ
jgi:hypothetical protein